MEEWVEIHRDNVTTTYASNVPGGVLIRCLSVYLDNVTCESMVYVPGAMIDGAKRLVGGIRWN